MILTPYLSCKISRWFLITHYTVHEIKEMILWCVTISLQWSWNKNQFTWDHGVRCSSRKWRKRSTSLVKNVKIYEIIAVKSLWLIRFFYSFPEKPRWELPRIMTPWTHFCLFSLTWMGWSRNADGVKFRGRWNHHNTIGVKIQDFFGVCPAASMLWF